MKRGMLTPCEMKSFRVYRITRGVMKVIDMVDRTFGLLVVREMLPGSQCRSDCACGTKDFTTESYSVRNGLTTSCGCLQSAGNHRTHGESVKGRWTAEYRAWVNMITRCTNPNATRYKDWGGRGISVCEEWLNDYPVFLSHVGRRPSAQHSLDRFPNPDGNYEPGNVRWATRLEQAHNKSARRVAA